MREARTIRDEKLNLNGLTPFQRRACLIIDEINGRLMANGLADKYRRAAAEAEAADGEEYDADEIVPIPAKCTRKRCGYDWVGRDAIRAPSLRNCRCLCDAPLMPHPDHPPVVDAYTRRHGLYGRPPQPPTVPEDVTPPDVRARLDAEDAARPAFDVAAWDAREAVIAARVSESRKLELFEHLADAPWGVEYLRGRVVTSLRDGATGTIETVDSADRAHVQWLDEVSSRCNSGSPVTRTQGRGAKAKQVVVLMSTIERSDAEWVLATREAVRSAFDGVEPLAAHGIEAEVASDGHTKGE